MPGMQLKLQLPCAGPVFASVYRLQQPQRPACAAQQSTPEQQGHQCYARHAAHTSANCTFAAPDIANTLTCACAVPCRAWSALASAACMRCTAVMSAPLRYAISSSTSGCSSTSTPDCTRTAAQLSCGCPARAPPCSAGKAPVAGTLRSQAALSCRLNFSLYQCFCEAGKCQDRTK